MPLCQYTHCCHYRFSRPEQDRVNRFTLRRIQQSFRQLRDVSAKVIYLHYVRGLPTLRCRFTRTDGSNADLQLCFSVAVQDHLQQLLRSLPHTFHYDTDSLLSCLVLRPTVRSRPVKGLLYPASVCLLCTFCKLNERAQRRSVVFGRNGTVQPWASVHTLNDPIGSLVITEPVMR